MTTERLLYALASIHMQIPQGVQVEGSNKVCKLIKFLYGLKQASMQWYEK